MTGWIWLSHAGRFKMQPDKRIKASIIGISGYTGLELLRLLLAHPHVDIGYLTSRQHENEPIGSLMPHLAHLDLAVTNTPADVVAKNSDVVFLCLPHKTAQEVVAALHGKTRLIDLSADFRLDDPAQYEKYYGEKHYYPGLLNEVVYGLPELVDKNKIKSANTVANPGCYALLGQLLLAPFKGMIESADYIGITGSSGLGKSPVEAGHHPVRNHNIRSYGVNTHRHIPEIIRAAGISESQLNFVPTSGPFTRGIFGQAFITLKNSQTPTLDHLYDGRPFVRQQKEIALANIVGSNFADVSFTMGRNGHVMAQGVIDNLVKGAGGTAVQNMNLMFGIDETAGLINLAPLYP
jgi:N-acetyl-gamma-glutamyl-phosphate reductase common form